MVLHAFFHRFEIAGERCEARLGYDSNMTITGILALLVTPAVLLVFGSATASEEQVRPTALSASSAILSMTVSIGALNTLLSKRAAESNLLSKATIRGQRHAGQVRWTVMWMPKSPVLRVQGRTLTAVLPGTLAPRIELSGTIGDLYDPHGCKPNGIELRFPVTFEVEQGRLEHHAGKPSVSGISGCTLRRKAVIGDLAKAGSDIANFFKPGSVPDPKPTYDVSAMIRGMVQAKANGAADLIQSMVAEFFEHQRVADSIEKALAQPTCLDTGVCLHAGAGGVLFESIAASGDQLRLKGVVGVAPGIAFAPRGLPAAAAALSGAGTGRAELSFTLLLPTRGDMLASVDASVARGRPTAGYAFLPVVSAPDIAMLRTYSGASSSNVVFVKSTYAARGERLSRAAPRQELSAMLGEISAWLKTDAFNARVGAKDLSGLRATISSLKRLLDRFVGPSRTLDGPSVSLGDGLRVVSTTVHLAKPSVMVEDVSLSPLGIEIGLQASAAITVDVTIGAAE